MSKTIYVSPEGKPYWTGEYPKPLEDMSNGPICDLNYAQALINEYAVNGRPDDFTVCIAGGTYRLTSPIVMGNDAKMRITYKPYEGEKVVFSGGAVIGGWEETKVNGVNVLVTELPADYPEPNSLFVDGQPSKKTVFPADGSKLRIDSLPANSSDGAIYGMCGFRAKKGDLSGLEKLESADAIILHYWIDERLPIKKYNAETETLYSDRYSKLELNDDSSSALAKYRLENVYSELKQPGQWFYDRIERKVYYVPFEGQTPETITAEVPVCDQLVLINGKAGKGGNITFEDITFTCTNSVPDGNGKFVIEKYGKKVKCGSGYQAASHIPGAITLKNADHCHFNRCNFENLGTYAIEIGNGCKCNIVENCTIHGCGAGGVNIIGGNYFEGDELATAYNRVENNHIYNNGMFHMQAVGVLVQNAFATYIGHNTIHDMRYTGISSGWVWGYTESRACKNIIEYNHIYNIGNGDLSDMGGIYMLGAQPGSEIRGNYVHHVKKAGYGGYGIYLDEGSAYILVEKNIVHDTDSPAFFFHYARENIVRYNIFASHGESCIGMCRADKYTYATVIKNILVTDEMPVWRGSYSFHFTETEMISDCNFIYSVNDKPLKNKYSSQEGVGDEVATWQHWLDTGHDKFSLIGDPGFASLDSFTLKEDSVAYEMGFAKDVSTALAGSSLCK